MLRRLIAAIVGAQQGWADPLGEWVQKFLGAILRPLRPLKDFLHGTWLGHALHPPLTDVVIGPAVVALVLDAAPSLFAAPADLSGLRVAADIAVAITVLGMLGAIATGLADYTDTDYSPPRTWATVHGLLMLAAFASYVVSLGMRLGQPAADRTLPIALSIVGLAIVLASSYLGGELVFKMGNMVDRHAWRVGSAKWTPLDATEIREGQPVRAKAGAQNLVVVRLGERVFALHDVCSHAGCDLSEGSVQGRMIQCSCHGSRFDLATGHVVGGPATYDQPRYEVRSTEGRLEVRRPSG